MVNLSGNTILLTGGGSGIGLALAKRFAADTNKVIIVGRRFDALQKAQSANPSASFEILQGDVGTAESRVKLHKEVLEKFPAVNMIVHNA
jgi:uncharacterized oxidoreductase